MAFVLDASMTMAWCFTDERTPESEAVLLALAEDDAIVPAVWAYEVGNATLRGLRRSRLSSSEVASFFRTLARISVSHHEPTSTRELPALLDLTREFGLSAYDAAYLQLAMRRGLPLASLDTRLRDAAGQAGVPLYVPAGFPGQSNA